MNRFERDQEKRSLEEGVWEAVSEMSIFKRKAKRYEKGSYIEEDAEEEDFIKVVHRSHRRCERCGDRAYVLINLRERSRQQHNHLFVIERKYTVEINLCNKLYDLIITGNEEVNLAGEVANWLATGLQSMLPENVKANLLKLAAAGHSRGGKTAFALALGHAKTQPSLKISALIGLDPVAGLSIDDQIEPKILTYVPHSFDLPVPISVAIIGTGLGHEKSSAIVPACAPNGVNHCEFFTECKPPSWYFYAKDYGHVDMLDDPNLILSLACVSGKGDKDPFKKCLGGVFVAFLRACLDGENEDLKCIVEEPTIAPVTLDPVIHIEA